MGTKILIEKQYCAYIIYLKNIFRAPDDALQPEKLPNCQFPPPFRLKLLWKFGIILISVCSQFVFSSTVRYIHALTAAGETCSILSF